MTIKELYFEITKLINVCHDEFNKCDDDRLKWYMYGLLLEDCLSKIKELNK